jgi:aspartyl-tRNA(Asn)/glutamyl-tRNA(Gln) amidotransferase subunit A
MTEAPLWSLTVAEASRRIAVGALSPIDLVEAFLDRIAAVDARMPSYVHVDAEGARAAARIAAADLAAGRRRGPLHGLPFAVKDNYDVAGLPTVANSRLRLGHVATRDAGPVARLKAAGAILLGKLSTWEYGTGNGGEYGDTVTPTTRNPWDLARFAGGSSIGAGAAVAAGTAMFALGSDTTGSVRLPAAACGVVGVKATPGRVSRHGLLPNCWSLDIPGPFTWTVEDAALVLASIAGHDPADPVTEDLPVPDYPRFLAGGVDGLRIAAVTDPGPGFPAPDAAMAAALHAGLDVLRGLGATIVETRLPVPADECFKLSRFIGPPESASIHEAEYRTDAALMGTALRDKMHGGTLQRAADYIAAQRQRRVVADGIDGLLSGFDALVTFGTFRVAPRLDRQDEMVAFTVETAMTPFNLSGHPALVQCTGFTPEGLPLSWQVVGHRFDEATILRVAAAYEAATAWREERAPVR